MRRIRSRLTYANVMVTILAFIVLGGGTAVAAIVVSDNSQVASNTISGHKPPAGKHANIIGGSVNGTDLATGAVTQGKIGVSAVTTGKLAGDSVNGAKVVNGSLTSADLNTNEVKQAFGIVGGIALDAVGSSPNVFSNDFFSLDGHCLSDGGNGHATITLTNNTPKAAFLTVEDGASERVDAASTSTPLTQTQNPGSVSQARGVNFSVLSLNGAYLEGRVQATFLDATEGVSPDPSCAFTFTGRN